MNLATIEKIINIKSAENSDNLELADVLGWQVVVKKNEFKINDMIVFVPIDTVLPEVEWCEFMRDRNFRVKTARFRNNWSQGLIFSLFILPEGNYEEGQDVADILGIIKYEKPEFSVHKNGVSRSTFPSWVGWSVTDEDNVQSNKKLIEELNGKEYYISLKCDGSSGSFTWNETPDVPEGELIVASRKMWLRDGDNDWWVAARNHNLEEILKSYPHYGIQAECVAPGRQKNTMGVTRPEIRIFNLFNKETKKYEGFNELLKFCNDTGLLMVSLVEEGDNFQYTLAELLVKVKILKYDNGHIAEGMVIRPKAADVYSEVLRGRLSFKVINPIYDIKN